jgi:DNA-binding transcriptional LysR family regulator
MQIRELERELKIDLVERRSGAIELTETDVEVARRREHVLAAARDLILLSAADVPRTAT